MHQGEIEKITFDGLHRVGKVVYEGYNRRLKSKTQLSALPLPFSGILKGWTKKG